jgi:hypothetical protein
MQNVEEVGLRCGTPLKWQLMRYRTLGRHHVTLSSQKFSRIHALHFWTNCPHFFSGPLTPFVLSGACGQTYTFTKQIRHLFTGSLSPDVSLVNTL